MTNEANIIHSFRFLQERVEDLGEFELKVDSNGFAIMKADCRIAYLTSLDEVKGFVYAMEKYLDK